MTPTLTFASVFYYNQSPPILTFTSVFYYNPLSCHFHKPHPFCSSTLESGSKKLWVQGDAFSVPCKMCSDLATLKAAGENNSQVSSAETTKNRLLKSPTTPYTLPAQPWLFISRWHGAPASPQLSGSSAGSPSQA